MRIASATRSFVTLCGTHQYRFSTFTCEMLISNTGCCDRYFKFGVCYRSKFFYQKLLLSKTKYLTVTGGIWINCSSLIMTFFSMLVVNVNRLCTVASQSIHYSRPARQQSLDFKICGVLKLDRCKYSVVKGRCNIFAEEPQIVYDLITSALHRYGYAFVFANNAQKNSERYSL